MQISTLNWKSIMIYLKIFYERMDQRMAETNKVIMLGNEAIARGAYEAGVKVSAAYPGTPSTEISEYLVQYKDSLYCE